MLKRLENNAIRSLLVDKFGFTLNLIVLFRVPRASAALLCHLDLDVYVKSSFYRIKGSREQLMDECFFASLSKRVFVQNIWHKNELMNLQVEVIRMVLRLDSFWRRGKRQLGYGILDEWRKCSWIKREEELIIVELFLALQWKTGKETLFGQIWWIGFDVHNIYVLFAGLRSVRMVKNCDRGLENAAQHYVMIS